eukprot:2924999-Prymnesium_polylepis.1
MGAGEAARLERLVESHARRQRRRDELAASGPAFWPQLIWTRAQGTSSPDGWCAYWQRYNRSSRRATPAHHEVDRLVPEAEEARAAEGPKGSREGGEAGRQAGGTAGGGTGREHLRCLL